MKRLAIGIILSMLVVNCSKPGEALADAATIGMMSGADIETGRAVAVACAECHGLDGKSTGSEIPHLAAQNPRYLLFTLQAYKQRARGSALMQAAVAPLTDADLVNVAGYYASLEPIKVIRTAPAVRLPEPVVVPDQAVATGKAAAAACAGCHGADGNSSIAGTPDLAGQDAQYLVTAVRAYMDGSRKHSVMQAAVATLSDKEVENLAAFYSVQEPEVPVRKRFSLKEWTERCNRCHEPSIENPVAAFPKIRGQPASYIAKALKTYQEGNARTSSVMHAMTGPLSEAEIEEIAAYYARQQAK